MDPGTPGGIVSLLNSLIELAKKARNPAINEAVVDLQIAVMELHQENYELQK